MNCTHEMKTGSVVTVVNGGGLAGGCSFCMAEQVERDRDGYRSALCDLLAAAHGTTVAEAAMEKARGVLKDGPPEPQEWADRPTPEDAAIAEAFPTRSGRHDTYQRAMRLVGDRHSKGALVALVNWLLIRIDAAPSGSEAK